MLGLFEGSLAVGLSGLIGMAGLQFTHGGSSGSHAGHGAHGGDSGGGAHLGDAGHAVHLGDGGHGVHLGDAGHGAHLGDSGHGAHLGDAGHGHVGDAGHGHVGDAGHFHLSDIGKAIHVTHPGLSGAGQGAVHGGNANAVPIHGEAAHGDPGHVEAGHAEAGHPDAAHGPHGDVAMVGPTPIHAPLWLVPSPIQVFSLLIGFGLAGIVFREWLPYYWTIAFAVVNAIVFERLLVHPYWEFLFRFASTPAGLLQGTVATKAIAVTTFNRSGCGLVRLCVDGESRDVLARMLPAEKGTRVRKGDAVFIEGANSDDSVIVSRIVPGPGERRAP